MWQTLAVMAAATLLMTIAAGCGDNDNPSVQTGIDPGQPLLEYVFICDTSSSDGIAFAQGEVTNISDQRLADIVVEANWFSEGDAFITTDTGRLQMAVLMPGQTAPFRLTSEYNPAMHNCALTFKEPVGPVIPSQVLKVLLYDTSDCVTPADAYGQVVTTGHVANDGDNPIGGLNLRINWSADGKPVTSAVAAIVQDAPLQPGETVPFRVEGHYDGEALFRASDYEITILSCDVLFMDRAGQTVRSYKVGGD